MRHIQSILILVFLMIGWVCCPIHGQAADFPNKPITLIVPYPAGGATDLVIRPLAEAAKEIPRPTRHRGESKRGRRSCRSRKHRWKETRWIPSLCGRYQSSSKFLINKLSFDTVKDVTPIIRLAGYLYGILVRSDSQFKTLKELLDYAKANPGKDQLHGLRRRNRGTYRHGRTGL